MQNILVFTGKLTCKINNCWVVENGISHFEIGCDMVEDISKYYNKNISFLFDTDVLPLEGNPSETSILTITDVSLQDGRTVVVMDKAALSIPSDRTNLFKVGEKLMVGVAEDLTDDDWLILA